MFVSITDEIIDAIIQNEHRYVCRPGWSQRSAQVPRAARNVAALKPDWGQFPPEAMDSYPRMQA